jgi:hypothetical protein
MDASIRWHDYGTARGLLYIFVGLSNESRFIELAAASKLTLVRQASSPSPRAERNARTKIAESAWCRQFQRAG